MPVYAISYLAGVVLVAFLPVLYSVLALQIMAICSLLILWVLLKIIANQLNKRKIRSWRVICVFSLSFCLASLHGHYLLSKLYNDQRYSRDCSVSGVVVGLPYIQDNYARFEFDLLEGHCNNQQLRLSTLLLSLYRSEYKVMAGDKLLLAVRLKMLRPQYSRGAFDRKLWAINRGVDGSGYVREIIDISPTYSTLSAVRQNIRQWIISLNISRAAKASFQALMLGDKSAISNSQWQQLRITGTVHLLVVSGLHIGIVVAIGWWLFFVLRACLQLLGVMANLRYFPAVGALLLSFSYLLLAGASLSTQRAWLMALVLIAGQWLSIRPNLWQRWWWALLLIISWQPLSVLQPGLWLSFLAVASLISLQGFRSNTGLRSVIVKSQWWVWLALMPLLLLFFGQVSWLSPLINIVAIGFISLLLFALLPAVLFTLLDWHWPLQLIGAALDYFWLAQQYIAQYSHFLVIQMVWVSTPIIVLIASSCLFLLLPLPNRIKAICGVSWILLFYPQTPKLPEQVQFKLTLIDVGQGWAVLVQTRSHNLLFDTGASFPSGFSYYDSVIRPLLDTQAIDHLDVLVISHGDNDHRGGLQDAREDLQIDRLELGMPDDAKTAGLCRSGKRWNWDGVSFQYRQPPRGSFTKSNNQSCVLELGTAACKVLIMADAEYKLERNLLASTLNANQQILVVGHHGSNTSSSSQFLARGQFSSALISSGYRNRYNHPHDQVLARLAAANSRVYRTDQLGSIELTASAEGCQIMGHRQLYRRYWW